MKKIICMLLVITMILGMTAPASAASKPAEDTYIEITSDTAPLRTGPGKAHETVVTLEKGDCLVMTGWSENRFGNIWYHCRYAGSDETVYVFADHVKFHTHTYHALNSEISYCACGRYEMAKKSGNSQMDAMVLTAGSLLTAEAVAATAELSALSTTIATGLSAAFPYVAVVCIGGMLIYMAVSRSGSQVKDVVKVDSHFDIQKMLSDMDGPEIYFAAALTFGDNPALLLVSDGMDLDDASDYLAKVTNSPTNAFISNLTNKSMLNIWTPLRDSATILCETFLARSKSFAYGNSSEDLFTSEHDRTSASWKIRFEHYHLLRIDSIFSLTKVRDIHIFFGAPLDIGSAA